MNPLAEMPPDGPHATANAFVRAVYDSDLGAAWPLLDEPLRRSLATDWAQANAAHNAVRASGGAERVVDGLAAADTFEKHPLWRPFAAAVVRHLCADWADVDLTNGWGWASGPRPLTLDTELVLLVEHPAGRVVGGVVAVRAIGFVLRHGDDGWTITSFDASLTTTCQTYRPA